MAQVAKEFDELDELCINTIRVLAADVVENADSGHPGAPLGLAPVAHILWSRILNGYGKEADWINRDRFVLSNGHACALQYIMLHLCGYDVTMEDLKKFRHLNSRTPGHPEVHITSGIEVSTGPLGQGIAQAVGLAIAEKHIQSKFNSKGEEDLINHKIYCVCGDGCMQEGVSSEACSLAGHLRLNNLVLIYDDNNITIDGKTDLSFTEKVAARFRSYNWKTLYVENGNNDYNAIFEAIKEAQNINDAPVLISVKTKIGFGSSKEDTHGVHGSPLGKESLVQLKKKFGFNEKEFFVVSDKVKKYYENTFIKRGQNKYNEWNDYFNSQYKKNNEGLHKEFKRLLSNELPSQWIENSLIKFDEKSKSDATRNISGVILNSIAKNVPEIIGGSADLTPSTKTELKCSHDFQGIGNHYDGRYLRFGVREFGMFAIGNGISAYGCNLIPFTSTFLNFITYGWGAVRLGSLSHLRHLYIMTHDSVFLGEDGPTHQPVEVLPLLRTTPNLLCLRPADGNEIFASYIIALEYKNGPTVVCLSRQNVDSLKYSSIDLTKKGAYVVYDTERQLLTQDEVKEAKEKEKEKENKENNEKYDLIFISTGSEVGPTLKAAKLLNEKNKFKVRVVSAPCLQLFQRQSADYIKSVIAPNTPVISVEASCSASWENYAHHHIAVDRFGASGNVKDIGEYFGFTPEKIAQSGLKYHEIWKNNAAPLLGCFWKFNHNEK